MPRRHLAVQNKDNDHDETLPTSKIVTRSATKRPLTDTDENISTKKSKTVEEDQQVDKENQRKRPRNKSKATSSTPVPPPVEVSLTDDDDDESHGNDKDEIDYPISSIRGAHDHPSNKHYLVFDDADPSPLIVSKTGRYWSAKYRKMIPHVYPDTYDMYIHADFSCYGELEIVENCVLDLTKAIFVVPQRASGRTQFVRKSLDQVNYIHAFRRLEALTILLDEADGISGIDDGDRFYDIMRVIGACYVTIYRGLLPKEMFEKCENIDEKLAKKLAKIAERIPNFKEVLEKSLIVGYLFLSIADTFSAYTTILRTVYNNWLFIMEQKTIDLDAKPNKSEEQLWLALKQAANIEKKGIEHGKKESFNFLHELQLYKRSYSMGGDYHDISKWSRSERAQYSFDRYDGYRGFWF